MRNKAPKHLLHKLGNSLFTLAPVLYCAYTFTWNSTWKVGAYAAFFLAYLESLLWFLRLQPPRSVREKTALAIKTALIPFVLLVGAVDFGFVLN